MDEAAWERRREEMLSLVAGRGICDPRVLEVMRRIPRHLFIGDSQALEAYEDRPLPIGLDQTISQPYITAYMTEKLSLQGRERVLEIGTGSGYQTAVLACLSGSVFTVEVEESLSRQAELVLGRLDLKNIRFRIGDGLEGWAEEAPFDRILLTAAVSRIPQLLLDQIAVGGCLLAPVGGQKGQQIQKVLRGASGYLTEDLIRVSFVPAHI